ncbi:M48 family metallopeptidase [uncultured Thiodictyon sp.]|jgi:predicted Zn-dependent protease|uniref:M48 family metallopeptidase n=1 Tax=uncultured Thiodictyon sp. TaxID=1846217 RepID=UPI0025FAF7E2|nr:M48 family metallopeptidase [uncultured Thiodictyon sp.]
MSMSNPLRGAALLLAVCALAACATAPETGRSQLLLVDAGQEAEMGLSAFQQKKLQTPISRDRAGNQQLQAVGGRIARVARLPNARWEFVLFADPEPNAFALPGGKVGVNTGILPITKDEAGLAAVVAHEIAHVSARHGAERMSQGMAAQVGGVILSVALEASGYGGATRSLATNAYGLGTRYGVLMPYSRLQEAEADRIGLLYMARAGYDPREAIAFWRRFQSYNAGRGGKGPEFLSTHPLDETRIAELQKFLPQAMAEYQRAGGRG